MILVIENNRKGVSVAQWRVQSISMSPYMHVFLHMHTYAHMYMTYTHACIYMLTYRCSPSIQECAEGEGSLGS